MSIGHGSGVIDKAWLDTLIADIEASSTFNTDFNIPLAGGSSKDGKTIYMDKAIPTTYKQTNGKVVNVTRYLCVHERIEKMLLDGNEDMPGMAYLPAHGAATAVELAAVQDDGLDVNQYDKFWDKWEKVAAKHKLGDGTPPDIETRPYEES